MFSKMHFSCFLFMLFGTVAVAADTTLVGNAILTTGQVVRIDQSPEAEHLPLGITIRRLVVRPSVGSVASGFEFSVDEGVSERLAEINSRRGSGTVVAYVDDEEVPALLAAIDSMIKSVGDWKTSKPATLIEMSFLTRGRVKVAVRSDSGRRNGAYILVGSVDGSLAVSNSFDARQLQSIREALSAKMTP